MNYGFTPSKLDGTEHQFECGTIKIPQTYSYKEVMSTIIDQGSMPICVPCSLSAYINWRLNILTGDTKDYAVSLREIYNSRPIKTDGMCFKDALHYLKHSGVTTTKGKFFIKEYAMVHDADQLKKALIMNGVCIGGLPVYSGNSEFWNGNMYQGGHAIAIVGYNQYGFIIRNSWGRSFGQGGYCLLTYDDYEDKMVECWTIIK